MKIKVIPPEKPAHQFAESKEKKCLVAVQHACLSAFTGYCLRTKQYSSNWSTGQFNILPPGTTVTLKDGQVTVKEPEQKTPELVRMKDGDIVFVDYWHSSGALSFEGRKPFKDRKSFLQSDIAEILPRGTKIELEVE